MAGRSRELLALAYIRYFGALWVEAGADLFWVGYAN